MFRNKSASSHDFAMIRARIFRVRRFVCRRR